MPESAIFKLNGIPLPAPTSAAPSWEDVHSPNSGRTLDGEMHIEIVTRKRKVALKWDVLTQEEMVSLQKLLQGTYYTLTYVDPLYGLHTIKCYVSGSQQDLYSAMLYNGLWRNISFNAIEV